MEEALAYREMISRILTLQPGDDAIVAAKIDVCRKYKLQECPRILPCSLSPNRVRGRRSGRSCWSSRPGRSRCRPGRGHDIARHPARTASACHARAAPNTSTSRRRVTPARSRQHCVPANTTTTRSGRCMPGSNSSRLLGHRVDKVELIVMGGTMTARTPEYQEQFVSRCIEAMNTYPGGSAAAEAPDAATVEAGNETSAIRCVAITFETRPDWCRREHIDRMLGLGVTKVELGVQHLDDEYPRLQPARVHGRGYGRGEHPPPRCGSQSGVPHDAEPPGSTIDADQQMFETLFADPRFRPDFLKIYPTLVTPGFRDRGTLAAGRILPVCRGGNDRSRSHMQNRSSRSITRLQRIQRDIPAKLIVAGSRHSNFRQLAQNRLTAIGKTLPVHPLPGDGQAPIRLRKRRSR